MEDLTQEFLAESREGLERMELCLTELERRPEDRELVAEIFRAVHTIKGTTGFLGFGRLQALAHAGESLLAALRDGRVAVTGELIGGLLELRDGLQAVLGIIEARGSEGERREDDDRELIGWMAELAAGSSGKGSPGTSQGRDAGQPAGTTPTSLQEAGHTAAVTGAPRNSSAGNQAELDRTLRIDVETLNQMMNLVGDLVLTRNRMLQCQPGDTSFAELMRRLNGVTTELRESVMQARLQPVGAVFARFPRMVRDLAQRCGRRVRIEFEGRETALDKGLLEAVRDPLTHAVRNAVDHGIEPEAERVLAGKPAEGVVRLTAYQQNGEVVIEVADDGAGISTERVLARAVERGLITAEAAAAMPEHEALQLIFAPGFSTAKEVTSVSGRGVGMDVVRSNVEQAGGRVEIESRVGTGTKLRLRVPLTLAIVPALVVECAGESFALPQRTLVELVHVPRGEAKRSIERIGAAELYRLRDGLLPLVRLDRILELERDSRASEGNADETRELYIAVLEPEGRRFGLVVDGLRPPEEIVVKPLSAALREIGVYAGATVLGSGALVMILDAAAVGVRAGVRSNEEDVRTLLATPKDAAGGREEVAAQLSMVLYETLAAGESGEALSVRMAVPLSAVERIATVPLSAIEYAGGRPVLQYDGELLPLEDEGGLLRMLRAGNSVAATVLICTRPVEFGADDEIERRRIGVVVRRVLDVCAGELLPADTAVCGSPVARVNERITALHRGFGAGGERVAAGEWNGTGDRSHSTSTLVEVA